MPISTIPCEVALDNQRDSPSATWPKRGVDENRIEPIAKPSFSPSFHFASGSTIFTIGSCFARHIEEVLARLGFIVPTREFWSDDQSGRANDNWMLDNYSVTAIYNEIAWAFGEVPYDPRQHLIEIRKGRFADSHLSGRIPLQPFADVLARRERIFKVTRSLLTADVAVMTLGLAEVWRDKLSGYFLNTRPLRGTLRVDPERYELCVLSYEDVRDCLVRTFDLVFNRCRPDLHVLLTVSPVPMSTTYTGLDVAVANQYSKSVLRAAAGEISRRYERIDYFPSYESVILSDRARAWEDDQLHVRRELVEHNVAAMIAAYTGVGEMPETSQSARFAAVEETLDLRRAREFLKARQFEKAIAAATLAFDTPLHADALQVIARAYLDSDRLVEAEAALQRSLEIKHNLSGTHGLLGLVRMRLKRYEDAAMCFSRALDYAPNTALWSARLAEAQLMNDRLDDASRTLEEALRLSPDSRALLHIQKTLLSRLTSSAQPIA